MSHRAPEQLDARGPAAPPRDNGELVFAEPWESRVFGLAVALSERGVFEWDEFREHLIAEIARWESEHGSRADDAESAAPTYRYYERWQAALERVLADKGVCADGELDARTRLLATRPHGHDH